MIRHDLRCLMLLCFCLTALAACSCGSDDDDDQAGHDLDDTADNSEVIHFVLPADSAEIVRCAVEDAAELLTQIPQTETSIGTQPVIGARWNIVLGDKDIIAAFFSDDELYLPEEAFRIRTATVADGYGVVLAGDARGLSWGLYDLLEIIGFRFFHPEQTYVPASLTLPESLDIHESPTYPRRGFHFHTMHPIEASEFLQVKTEKNRRWAKNLILWLARNKQNYWQFELLRTVDYDEMIDYYKELVDYSHAHGVDAGVVVTWVFQQQKAWKLLPNQFGGAQLDKLDDGIDLIMQVPWDHMNLEMGSTEFTPVSDLDQIAWMNETVRVLAEKYPACEASVKIHCSSGQTAGHYGDINFNFLAQEADARLAVYPHTVMYYDLQGPAPAYDNQDFQELYDWMLTQIGERKIYYYPETAYWCSFDIDVPLFLPVYFFNRWKDIRYLADLGLDGHVTFTSGHEWNYWLNDWIVARAAWNAAKDWTDDLSDVTVIFGDAQEDIESLLEELTLFQEDTLIGRELASYLAGQDTWDELGYLVGSTTHPKPVQYSELYRMDADAVTDFRENVLANLEEAFDSSLDLYTRFEALRPQIPSDALSWFEEMSDGYAVDYFRAAHAYHLWAGAASRRMAELGVEADGETTAQAHFSEALSIKEQFLETMRERESGYRYPTEYSISWRRSVTSYDFGYLYQASTGYWYERYEKQAIDKNFNPLLMNIIDPIWFFF